MDKSNQSKPTVIIKISSGTDHFLIQEVLYGIEEEGIPYAIEVVSKEEAQLLAYQSARQSKVNVGIGFSNNCLVLHQRNLSENLFVYRLKDIREVSLEALRIFGINSARLVKNIPFNISQELEVLE